VKTENQSVLRKSRFGSVFYISVQFFGLKPNRRHHYIFCSRYINFVIYLYFNYCSGRNLFSNSPLKINRTCYPFQFKPKVLQLWCKTNILSILIKMNIIGYLYPKLHFTSIDVFTAAY